MKRKPRPKKSESSRLIRDRDTYEFIVRRPHGASAISGYRRAARHFGLHTQEDPSCGGSDSFRMFVSKDARKLRLAAKTINQAYATDDEDNINAAESHLLEAHDIHFFSSGWKSWDSQADEGTLEQLGWKRSIVEKPNHYRVTIQQVRRRR